MPLTTIRYEALEDLIAIEFTCQYKLDNGQLTSWHLEAVTRVELLKNKHPDDPRRDAVLTAGWSLATVHTVAFRRLLANRLRTDAAMAAWLHGEMARLAL